MARNVEKKAVTAQLTADVYAAVQDIRFTERKERLSHVIEAAVLEYVEKRGYKIAPESATVADKDNGK